MTEWALAFALTLALELPVYRWLLRPWPRNGWAWLLLVNMASHPWLWTLFRPSGWFEFELLAWELGVIVFEGFALAVLARTKDGLRVRPTNALLAAALANATSAALGMALMYVALG